MKIKSTAIYLYTLIKTDKIKKRVMILSVAKDGQQQELSYTAGWKIKS